MIPVQGQLTDLGGLGSQAESSYKVALPPDAPTSLDLVSSPGQKSIWPGLSRRSFPMSMNFMLLIFLLACASAVSDQGVFALQHNQLNSVV